MRPSRVTPRLIAGARPVTDPQGFKPKCVVPALPGVGGRAPAVAAGRSEVLGAWRGKSFRLTRALGPARAPRARSLERLGGRGDARAEQHDVLEEKTAGRVLE